MRISFLTPCILFLLATSPTLVRADQTNIAEDDASQDGYRDGFQNGKNGGSGFGEWKMATVGNDNERHAGFFIATTDNNKDLNGIAQNGKAWGFYANGTGFEEAVAFRAFKEPLAVGDSFSFLMETGRFEKKFDRDEGGGDAIGLTLRTGHASDATSDYNRDAVFEIGQYEGKSNYQVLDGSSHPDTGVACTDQGVIITVTITGANTYDLELQTVADEKLTKLPGRKLKSAGAVTSLALFDRNGERSDAFFNGLQVARENK